MALAEVFLKSGLPFLSFNGLFIVLEGLILPPSC
jgi:hypothetical protein